MPPTHRATAAAVGGGLPPCMPCHRAPAHPSSAGGQRPAEATLPAGVSVSGSACGGGERARDPEGGGVGGMGGRALPAVVVVDFSAATAGAAEATLPAAGAILRPPQDKATSDRLGLHQPLQL